MPAERESEIGAIRALGPGAHPPESKYERLIGRAKSVVPGKTIVVHPCDESSLRGAIEAAKLGIIRKHLRDRGERRLRVDEKHVELFANNLLERRKRKVRISFAGTPHDVESAFVHRLTRHTDEQKTSDGRFTQPAYRYLRLQFSNAFFLEQLMKFALGSFPLRLR